MSTLMAFVLLAFSLAFGGIAGAIVSGHAPAEVAFLAGIGAFMVHLTFMLVLRMESRGR